MEAGLIEFKTTVKKLAAVCLLLICHGFSSFSVAEDVIKISQGQSERDQRTKYTYEVLDTALKLSESRYGPYKIEIVGRGKPNLRALKLLQDGEVINVALAITRPKWEQTTIAIRVPVRMGLLSYRLLAVDKSNTDIFEQVETVADLKKLRVGLRLSWATSDLMKLLGYNVINAYTYDSIFSMLHEGRFDYIPRGVHEIYDEIAVRQKELPNLVVEPNLLMYIPSPYYVFVSKKTPRIAERLRFGLEKMVELGVFREMIERHYGDFIRRANLRNRKIIRLSNPLLPEYIPSDNKDYWISFDELL